MGHLGRASGHLEAVLGRLGEPKWLIFFGFSLFFATSKFRTKIVILADLEAILGPLGTILGPLGALLGRSWSSPEALITIGRGAGRPFQDPPPPSLSY